MSFSTRLLSISKRPSWRYRSKASYSLKLLPAADNLVIESQEQAPAIWKGLKERAQELQPKLLPKSTLGQAVNSTRTKQSGRKRNGNWRIAFFLAISFALRMTISNRAAGLVQRFGTFERALQRALRLSSGAERTWQGSKRLASFRFACDQPGSSGLI